MFLGGSGSRYGFFASTGSVDSNGSDSPSLLTAFTLNLYFLPGVKPSTVSWSASGSASPHGTQRPVSWKISKNYKMKYLITEDKKINNQLIWIIYWILNDVFFYFLSFVKYISAEKVFFSSWNLSYSIIFSAFSKWTIRISYQYD